MLDLSGVKFTQAARRHRIGRAHALFVIDQTTPVATATAQGSSAFPWVGPDDRGIELEIVAVILPDLQLIIHVMPTALRKGREGMRDVSEKYGPVGPDVDLDNEVVLLPSGERLTNELAEQIVAQTRKVGGRPSLTGGRAHSPRVAFRVPEPILARAEQQAAAEQVSLSVLARKALERYLDSNAAS